MANNTGTLSFGPTATAAYMDAERLKEQEINDAATAAVAAAIKAGVTSATINIDPQNKSEDPQDVENRLAIHLFRAGVKEPAMTAGILLNQGEISKDGELDVSTKTLGAISVQAAAVILTKQSQKQSQL